MNGTAVEAKNTEGRQKINFISEAHEKFFMRSFHKYDTRMNTTLRWYIVWEYVRIQDNILTEFMILNQDLLSRNA